MFKVDYHYTFVVDKHYNFSQLYFLMKVNALCVCVSSTCARWALQGSLWSSLAPGLPSCPSRTGLPSPTCVPSMAPPLASFQSMTRAYSTYSRQVTFLGLCFALLTFSVLLMPVVTITFKFLSPPSITPTHFK